MKGRWIRYSAVQLRWIEANKTLTRRALHAAFVAKFGRTDVTLDHLKALCSRRKWNTGRTGHFEKGIIPANKGKKMPPGVGGNHPNARRTQFKKGARQGRSAENYKPIGVERVTVDGYIERKIHDGLPMQSRWRAVHLIRWEELHGPLPKGHCLKCVDGNKANTDPSNWILVSRAVLGLLNRCHNGLRYDDAPPELKPSILAIAKLKVAAGKAAP